MRDMSNQTSTVAMGTRRFGAVNWLGLYTLCAR